MPTPDDEPKSLMMSSPRSSPPRGGTVCESRTTPWRGCFGPRAAKCCTHYAREGAGSASLTERLVKDPSWSRTTPIRWRAATTPPRS